jgi:hypothetical protein
VTEQFLDVEIRMVDGVEVGRIDRIGFGPLNRERLPGYKRLDLRVTRNVEFPNSRLEVFLDIFNVTNRRNLRGYEYYLGPWCMAP